MTNNDCVSTTAPRNYNSSTLSSLSARSDTSSSSTGSTCPEALIALAEDSVRSVLTCASPTSCSRHLPSLIDFLREIYARAALTEIALVVSLIYVERLKKVLSNMARGEPDTPFRIFLSALLAATKFLHEDGSGLNRTFASITNGYYTLADINTMERSFLGLLQFSLLVTEQDLVDYIKLHERELEGLDLLPMLKNAQQHHH